MFNYTLLRWLGFAAGGALALFGLGLLLLACSGNVIQGKTGLLATALVQLGLSIPLFALPFSRRVARNALLVVLCPMAAGLLWLVFHSEQALWIHQLAAIAFAMLLAVRIALARRREQPA